MSQFEWGSAQNVRLSGPQTAALRNHALALIEILEQRRLWIDYVVKLFPDLPNILRPEMCAWYCFRKFRRAYILKYNARTKRWVLDLAKEPPANPNDGAGDARPRVNNRSRQNAEARPARAKRPPKATRKRIVCKTYKKEEIPLFGHTTSHFKSALGRLRGAREGVVAALSSMRVWVRHRIQPFAPEVRNLFIRFAEAATHSPNGEARLEPRLVGAGTGLSLVLSTFVSAPQTIDWEAWLFGRLSEIDWEGWLFGRLTEEEPVLYEVCEGSP